LDVKGVYIHLAARFYRGKMPPNLSRSAYLGALPKWSDDSGLLLLLNSKPNEDDDVVFIIHPSFGLEFRVLLADDLST
jgi:hypothetical protein